MKKQLCMMFCTAAMLCSMACPALAAVPVESMTGMDSPVPAPLPNTVYPAEVRASEENGMIRLEKIYYLTAKDDPAAIPTGDFEREGKHYTLLDLLKTDQTEQDTKEYIEVVTLDSDTKDVAEIIRRLAPEREITTEDGYHGTLKPDYPSITVEVAGYQTNSHTVSATRTYPNLPDADTALIPKSIADSGRTLTLSNVDWQNAAEYSAARYTAVASYTGTAYSKSATGYTVTVEYGGEVSKSSCDTVIYTAVFSATGKMPVVQDAEDTDNPFVEKEKAHAFDARLLLIPLGGLTVAAGGFGAYKGYQKYLNKKRGYE